MDLTALQSLIKTLTNDDLKKVMAHPDWAAAYEALCETQSEKISDFWDLETDAQFVQVLSVVSVWIHNDKLVSDSYTCPTGGYVWENGEWVMGDESKDDEEEGEEEDNED